MAADESEERYRGLLGAMEEGFCVVEVLFDAGGRRAVDYRFVEVNGAFERQTGLVGAVGRRMRELAPGHEEHWFEVYGRVAVTGETVRFEHEARALGGRWYEVTAFRVGPADRRRVGILFKDVAELRRGEAERARLQGALGRERARLAAVIEQAPAFMAVLRGPGHVFEVANERYYQLVGRREIVGRPVREALPEVAGQGFFELLDRVYETGEAFAGRDMRVSVRREAGRPPEERFLEFVYQPLREVDGSVSGILVHGVDVTEWRRAEDALRESEGRFRELADAMPQMVFAADAAGHVDYFNRRWYEYTGLPAGTVGYESWRGVHTVEGLRRVEEVWPEALRTGRPYEIEYQLRRRDGAYRWHLGRAVPVRDEAGRVVRWFGTNTDIHDQKMAQAELAAARVEAEAANRAKDRFLAVLSHELRTPLTPVAMAATAMEMDPGLPFEFRDDVSMIRRNVELETRLIDDLLDLSRVISGKLRISRQPVHVHAVVRHVLETVGAELHEKRLVVATDLRARRDLVDADPARLQQALWNLLKNAGKFTPSGGRVTIRTRNEGQVIRGKGQGEDEEAEGTASSTSVAPSSVVIEVSDTGRGIAAGVLPRIFDPFEQGADEVTRRHGGLGLGLAIAKAVVDLHGGKISAASEGEGRGATFAVRLPLRKEAGVTEVRPGPAERRDAGAAGAARVLLVEDHPDTAKTLARLLRLSGFEVEVAHSVAAALEAAGVKAFDVVVSDLGLPDGTGHDLMRGLGGGAGVVGIAMSGYGMEEDIRRSREAGFAEHLVKPVDLQRLREAIARAARGRG